MPAARRQRRPSRPNRSENRLPPAVFVPGLSLRKSRRQQAVGRGQEDRRREQAGPPQRLHLAREARERPLRRCDGRGPVRGEEYRGLGTRRRAAIVGPRSLASSIGRISSDVDGDIRRSRYRNPWQHLLYSTGFRVITSAGPHRLSRRNPLEVGFRHRLEQVVRRSRPDDEAYGSRRDARRILNGQPDRRFDTISREIRRRVHG